MASTFLRHEAERRMDEFHDIDLSYIVEPILLHSYMCDPLWKTMFVRILIILYKGDQKQIPTRKNTTALMIFVTGIAS